MEMQINPQEILMRLDKLQADMNLLLQSREINEDCILDKKDIEALEKAEEEYKNGGTISQEELKKELGL